MLLACSMPGWMEGSQCSHGQFVLYASQRTPAARAFYREQTEKIEYIPCQTEIWFNLEFEYMDRAKRLHVKRLKLFSYLS